MDSKNVTKSEAKENQANSEACEINSCSKKDQVVPTSIGGSALIEGLMMIGPENAAIGVRMPDGRIVLNERPIAKRDKLTKIWIVRGVVNFFRQMVLVYKAMTYSAHFFDLEEEENDAKEVKGAEKTENAENVENVENVESTESAAKPEKKEEQSKFDAWLEKKLGSEKAMDYIIYFSIIFSLGLSILLFSVAPYLIVNFFSWLIGTGPKSEMGYVGNFIFNLCSGAVRLMIFIGYLMLASLMKDIKRVWQYHGAEHKTIHCFEHGEALTVENIRKYSKHHPRCGTSFLLIIMVLGILMVSVVNLGDNSLVNILVRILMIPLIAGVSYEVLKWVGTSNSKWITWLNAPGMWFQHLTTKEPDDDMIEVAIVAMINAMPMDQREAQSCAIPFVTDSEVEAEKAEAENAETEKSADEKSEAEKVEVEKAEAK